VSEPTDKRTISAEEFELRRKLAIMCRIVGMQGSIGLYGHISIRVPDTDIVLLTPGATFCRCTRRRAFLPVACRPGMTRG
jgi:hypothetical protein